MNGPRQELQKQSQVVEELGRQADDLFSKLRAQRNTTEKPAEHECKAEVEGQKNKTPTDNKRNIKGDVAEGNHTRNHPYPVECFFTRR